MRHKRLTFVRKAAALLAVVMALSVPGRNVAYAVSRHLLASGRKTVSAGSSATPTPPGESATASPHPTAGSATSPYRVVGLGDSVPAGTACGCTSYVVQAGRKAARRQGRSAAVTNLAEPGLTTAGLAAQLRRSAVRGEIADADLIIITIGANDFDPDLLAASACQPSSALSCYQSALKAESSRLSAVLGEINAIQTNRDGKILVTGYWNVFLDGQVGRDKGATYVTGSNALTLADNARIASAAAANGATYIDIYTPFKGDGSKDDTDLLAADGDHPNAVGHALIARTVLEALA